ncbi:hypothetical protein DH2020_003918 [Rehmannia glutinosa]|uniref:Peptidase S9A N-terminal domain-containing protein n=1 Tax=Rehmannia glutinosa TaxID=99300 RepID=A0ABR0XN21_REHGL
MEPPIAKKVRHEMEMFGDVRIDNYYWLRDDSRSDPQVLAYLHEENAYTDHVMSGTKQLEDQIYSEIRGRLKEDDVSTPLRRGNYYYYRRTLEGKEYVQHCRRLVANIGAHASVYDTMSTEPDAPQSMSFLMKMSKLKNMHFTALVSPNNKLVAYAEDTKGDEIYTVYVIDAESRTPVGKPLVGVTSDLEWAGDNALVYTTRDEILRPDKVWLHKMGTEQYLDPCLYHEKDDIVSIQDMQLFSDHLVVYEREDGLPKITIYNLPRIGEPLDSLQGGRTVDFVDPIYSVAPSESQFSSGILRFHYSSMRTPPSVYDYDMNSGTLVPKKIDVMDKIEELLEAIIREKGSMLASGGDSSSSPPAPRTEPPRFRQATPPMWVAN